MNGKYLLDTNIVIGLFANDLKIVAKIQRASEIAVPCIVIGELCQNAPYKSRRHFSQVGFIVRLLQMILAL